MQQLLNELRELNLSAMATKLEELCSSPLNQELSLREQMSLMVNAQLTLKRNRKIQRLLRESGLNTTIRLGDLEFDEKRGFSRSQYLEFMRLDFVKQHHNIVITGATGCGKTHLASALGNQACIDGLQVKFVKLPVFLDELVLSRQNGSFYKLLQRLLQVDLLILDDFGVTPINEAQRHDLLTIVDERYRLKSTIITSQLEVKAWHSYLGEPTVADAILDRVLSQSHRIALTGASLRWKDGVGNQENTELSGVNKG